MRIGDLNISYNPYKIEQDFSKKEIKADPVKSVDSESKVERIKREIAEGTYKVDIEKTASAIANSLIS